MNAEERTRRIHERKVDTGKGHKLWCKGEWREFPIYRVETSSLLLNVDNRRFAAERKLMEHELGRALDPESNPVDLQSVVTILTSSNPHVDGEQVVGSLSKDYEGLKSDWVKRGQETPFWIRPDGTVRNGNRRLAMLLNLRETQGADAYSWVQAIVLEPADIDEQDLFEMEQREQLTENFKIRYTDINLLLTLRDAAMARQIDWGDPRDLERVATDLQEVAGGDKAYALKQLRAIKYMDAYLDDSNAPGQYHKLLRQVERFRDVGTVMAKMEEHPDDQPDMLQLVFAAIRAGNPHGHIRQFYKRVFVKTCG